MIIRGWLLAVLFLSVGLEQNVPSKLVVINTSGERSEHMFDFGVLR